MRSLLTAVCLFFLSSPAIAGSYSGSYLNTLLGIQTDNLSGMMCLAASSNTPNTYTIRLLGQYGSVEASSGTFRYSVKAASGVFTGDLTAATFWGSGAYLTGIPSSAAVAAVESESIARDVLIGATTGYVTHEVNPVYVKLSTITDALALKQNSFVGMSSSCAAGYFMSSGTWSNGVMVGGGCVPAAIGSFVSTYGDTMTGPLYTPSVRAASGTFESALGISAKMITMPSPLSAPYDVREIFVEPYLGANDGILELNGGNRFSVPDGYTGAIIDLYGNEANGFKGAIVIKPSSGTYGIRMYDGATGIPAVTVRHDKTSNEAWVAFGEYEGLDPIYTSFITPSHVDLGPPVTMISSGTIKGPGGLFVQYGVAAASGAFAGNQFSSSGAWLNAGNVGVGTASPGAVFDVAGLIRSTSAIINGPLVASTGAGDTYAMVGYQSATTGNVWAVKGSAYGAATTNIGVEGYANNATNNYSFYTQTPNAGANNFVAYFAGGAKAYFAGDVGIGTTSPSSSFHVVSLSSAATFQGTRCDGVANGIYNACVNIGGNIGQRLTVEARSETDEVRISNTYNSNNAKISLRTRTYPDGIGVENLLLNGTGSNSMPYGLSVGTLTTTGNVQVGGEIATTNGNIRADNLAGAYISIEPGAADAPVVIRADAHAGDYTPMIFKTSGVPRLCVDKGASVTVINASMTVQGNLLANKIGINATGSDSLTAGRILEPSANTNWIIGQAADQSFKLETHNGSSWQKSLGVSGTGIVSMPYQPFVQAFVAQSVMTQSVFTQLFFGSVSSDTASMWGNTAASGTFTVPAGGSGFYTMSSFVALPANNPNTTSILYKMVRGGTASWIGDVDSYEGTNNTRTLVGPVVERWLEAGDQISVWMVCPNAVTILANNATYVTSVFQMRKIQ